MDILAAPISFVVLVVVAWFLSHRQAPAPSSQPPKPTPPRAVQPPTPAVVPEPAPMSAAEYAKALHRQQLALLANEPYELHGPGVVNLVYDLNETDDDEDDGLPF